MNVELTTVGERGQTVIPKVIRDRMPAPKGTIFSIVLIDRDTIVMRRFDKQKLAQEFRNLRKSISKKFSDEEIIDEIKQSRKS